MVKIHPHLILPSYASYPTLQYRRVTHGTILIFITKHLLSFIGLVHHALKSRLNLLAIVQFHPIELLLSLQVPVIILHGISTME